jgi:hypothetical protein
MRSGIYSCITFSCHATASQIFSRIKKEILFNILVLELAIYQIKYHVFILKPIILILQQSIMYLVFTFYNGTCSLSNSILS